MIFNDFFKKYKKGERMKISIVTVCYNSAETIERTIKSVIGQDYDNIEYIVIDGGSIDGTVDLIQRYEQNIAYWVSEEDGGIYDAMNKGIEYATGEIIAFLNSDDWYEENILGEIARRFEEPEVQIICGDMYCHNGKTVTRYHVSEQNGKRAMRYEMGYPHQTMFARKDLFARYGRFDTQYQITADYDWLLRVYDQHVRIGTIDRVLTNFQYGGVSTRADLIEKQIEERRQVALSGLERNRELTQEEKEKWRLFIEDNYAESRYGSKVEWVMKRIMSGEDAGALMLAKGFFSRSEYEVFGCGTMFEEVRAVLNNMGITVTRLWDNDRKKWGKSMDGIEIGNPEDMKAGQSMVIITSTSYEQEMEEQLCRHGFRKNVHYVLYSELRKQIAGVMV